MKPGEPIPVDTGNTPQEKAILDLYRSLGESDRRDIQSAAEEKKRLRDVEQRLEELMATRGAESKVG